jgi:hypothetical protein
MINEKSNFARTKEKKNSGIKVACEEQTNDDKLSLLRSAVVPLAERFRESLHWGTSVSSCTLKQNIVYILQVLVSATSKLKNVIII